MEPYIITNLSDITYKSELILGIKDAKYIIRRRYAELSL